jgi:hypothetical protein
MAVALRGSAGEAVSTYEPPICHQRRVRDRLAEADPRPAAASLDGYVVETVGRDEARALIERYEWLGNLGRANLFVGLLGPARDLQGVAAFGHGPQGRIRDLVGSPALCLERGACTHLAPANAASYLISRACKLAHRVTGAERFFAYADPSAGERGAVYQAAGWIYLGQGPDARGGRAERFAVCPPDADPDDPASWRTTRALRRAGRVLSWAEAEQLGWRMGARPAKHVYATHVGRGRYVWRRSLPSLPYPVTLGMRPAA